MAEVLTAGETMALLDPLEDGEPHAGATFTLRFAGAESNFAIALARLRVSVAWASRLGTDVFGDMIERGLTAEGVDLSWVGRSGERTGLFVKWRTASSPRSAYYRQGSAAAGLAPRDVPDQALDGVRVLHLTGITMAISESARELVLELAYKAKERDVTVTFDPNFRPALPDTPDAAARRQRAVLPFVDWYLCGEEERRLLWDDSQPPVRTVTRVGARGAMLDGELVPPARPVEVRDEIGAGDAFDAGFVYGLLQGWDPLACVRAGNTIAAYALTGTGDWETLPHLRDVEW